jgi:2'-5' RNA ligase
MPAQDALPGFEVIPEQTDRLFFGVFLEPASFGPFSTFSRRLRGVHGLRGEGLEEERLHVTLHHIGDHAGLPSSLVDAAMAAADRVQFEAFDLYFDQAMTFGHDRRGKKPYVLLANEACQPVMDLHRRLGDALRATLAGRWIRRQFTPHMTLAYDHSVVARHAIEPIGFRVREVRLVHSLLGEHRHVVLGRWPLVAATGEARA